MQKEFIKKQKDFYFVWSHMNQIYARWADFYEINYNTFMIFYYGNMTQKMMGKHYGLPKQTVNNIIKSMQKAGHVMLISSENDKREKLVALTQQGKNHIAPMLNPLCELEQQTMQMVGYEQVEQMLKIGNLFNTIFEMKMEEKINEQI